MKRHRVFFEMVLAVVGLGLYLWYLHHIDYHINWALVGFLMVICLAVSLFFARKRS